jgi:hypothetical protein
MSTFAFEDDVHRLTPKARMLCDLCVINVSRYKLLCLLMIWYRILRAVCDGDMLLLLLLASSQDVDGNVLKMLIPTPHLCQHT